MHSAWIRKVRTTELAQLTVPCIRNKKIIPRPRSGNFFVSAKFAMRAKSTCGQLNACGAKLASPAGMRIQFSFPKGNLEAKLFFYGANLAL